MKCLNCENEYNGAFCNLCGQKASTQKITFINLFSDFFYLITNTDKGLFFNFINLTIAPRKTILNFIKGQRKNLFLPIQYAVLGLTLITLVDYYFGLRISTTALESSSGFIKNIKKGNAYFDTGKNVGEMLKGNIKYFLFSYIFLFALPAKLFYKYFSLSEHVVIQAFVIGHAAFITLFLFPLLNIPPLMSPVFYGSISIMTFSVFYKKGEIAENLFSALFIIIIGIILFFILALSIYTLTA